LFTYTYRTHKLMRNGYTREDVKSVRFFMIRAA